MADASKESRRSGRATVIFTAALEHDGCSIPVKVSNVSVSGALVSGRGLPPEGSPVVFRRNELVVDGRIAWIDCSHAGIAFNTVLQLEELLRRVPQLRHVRQPHFRRPGLRERP